MSDTFTILPIVLAVLFIAVGSLKVGKQQRMRASARHLGYSVGEFQAIGGAEIAGGAGLLAGHFWSPIGIAAAVGLVALLVGAVLSIRRAGDGPRDMVPALWIGVLAGVIAVHGVTSA
ncbi:MAG TPA: DoxX family protein [Mycobacteriales bacterium]|nr:DoxX family protein [Mycobacteriales bacterium]